MYYGKYFYHHFYNKENVCVNRAKNTSIISQNIVPFLKVSTHIRCLLNDYSKHYKFYRIVFYSMKIV